MGNPDYIVRVTGAMPDGTVVDRKFECVEDAFKLSREMVVVNVEYLKSIVLRQSIGKSHAVEPLTKEQQKERDRQYSLERWRSIMRSASAITASDISMAVLTLTPDSTCMDSARH